MKTWTRVVKNGFKLFRWTVAHLFYVLFIELRLIFKILEISPDWSVLTTSWAITRKLMFIES